MATPAIYSDVAINYEICMHACMAWRCIYAVHAWAGRATDRSNVTYGPGLHICPRAHVDRPGVRGKTGAQLTAARTSARGRPCRLAAVCTYVRTYVRGRHVFCRQWSETETVGHPAPPAATYLAAQPRPCMANSRPATKEEGRRRRRQMLEKNGGNNITKLLSRENNKEPN